MLAYVFDNLERNALDCNFSRLQLAALFGVALVFGKKPRATVSAVHKALERCAFIGENSDNLPVVCLLRAFDKHKVAFVYANIYHRITCGTEQVTVAVEPLFGNSNVALYFLAVIFGRAADYRADNSNAAECGL